MKAEEQQSTEKNPSKLTMCLRNVPISTSNILSCVTGATLNTFLHTVRVGWREKTLISLFSSFPMFLSACNRKDEGILFVNGSCSGALFRLHGVKYLQRCLTVR